MSGWKASAAFFCVVLFFVPLVLSIATLRPEAPVKSGPKDITEVLAIANQLGWHVGSDRSDGGLSTRRIILSETPLSLECINSLVYGRADDPAWIGKVAVYNERLHRSDTLSTYEDLVVWGKFLLYGDARLIEKLVPVTETWRSN